MNFNREEVETLINTKIEDYTKKYGKDFKFAVLEILSLEKMLLPQGEQIKHSKIIPLSEWNKYHNYPTVRALRAYYYDKKSGFDYCIEYGGNNGGRILINEDKYFEWQNNKKKFAK